MPHDATQWLMAIFFVITAISVALAAVIHGRVRGWQDTAELREKDNNALRDMLGTKDLQLSDSADRNREQSAQIVDLTTKVTEFSKQPNLDRILEFLGAERDASTKRSDALQKDFRAAISEANRRADQHHAANLAALQQIQEAMKQITGLLTTLADRPEKA